ncbi:MAG: thioredoxin-dependent thiol peroxidase [bacterium]|nr:thioredoxin-dependent thiol peroxidase [bacterium]
MLKIGERAIDFSLPNKEGRLVSLKDFLGKWVILYFYPKDNTSGCTLEAIEFTGLVKEFEKLNGVILGVSKDSVKSHQSFAKKHSLNIELLSDESASVIKAYGAWGKKKMYGKEYEGTIRSTFIIDPDGYIRYVFEDVDPKGHAEEVLKKLRELQIS